jgi:hypothetical protein
MDAAWNGEFRPILISGHGASASLYSYRCTGGGPVLANASVGRRKWRTYSTRAQNLPQIGNLTNPKLTFMGEGTGPFQQTSLASRKKEEGAERLHVFFHWYEKLWK